MSDVWIVEYLGGEEIEIVERRNKGLMKVEWVFNEVWIKIDKISAKNEW